MNFTRVLVFVRAINYSLLLFFFLFYLLLPMVWLAETDSSKVSREVPRTCSGSSSASTGCGGWWRNAKGKCSGTGKFTVVVGDLGRKAIEDPKEIPQDHVCWRPGILFSRRFINKTVQGQGFSKITFVIIFVLCVCFLLFCTLYGRSTGRPGRLLADVRFPTGISVPSLTL